MKSHSFQIFSWLNHAKPSFFPFFSGKSPPFPQWNPSIPRPGQVRCLGLRHLPRQAVALPGEAPELVVARHAAQRGAAGAEAAEVGGGAAVAEHLQEVDLEQEMCEIS